MAELLADPRAQWALAIVVLLPVAIIAAGELEERLRQRDSGLTPVASVVRSWVIPLLAVWLLIVALLDLPRSNPIVRLEATALLVSIAVAALMLVGYLVTRWASPTPDGERRRIPQLLLVMPKVTVIIVASWVLIDGVWGVDLSAALTALGVTSLVISFALQDTLSGLASGFLLLADAPFAPGDWIKAEDLEGRVVDIKWRSSRIETRNGDILVVPNAFLAGAVVTNFYQPTRLHRVVVPVQVAFSNPPTSAVEMLLAAARGTERVLEDPPPNVRVVQIDDPLMGYEVDLWIDDALYAPKVFSDFGALVWYQSHRLGVPLPSPAYDLYHHEPDGDEATDPEEAVARLRQSPLLDQLAEDDLRQLATASRLVRYQRGETVIDARTRRNDICLLWRGSAALVVVTPDRGVAEVSRLDEGDIFGLITSSEEWTLPVAVRALEDCEIVVVPESAAGEIASRNAPLSAALNHIVASRTRRVERMMRRLAAESAQAEQPGRST